MCKKNTLFLIYKTKSGGSLWPSSVSTMPGSSTHDHSSFKPNSFGRLGALGTQFSSHDVEVKRLGAFLNQGAFAGFIIWITLVFVVFYASPPESYEYLEGHELKANLLLFVLLFVTNGSRLLPLFFKEHSQFMNTGAMTGSFTIQGIALASCGIMICLPTPVLMDTITNRRVHLMRWVEWIPLAFLMTFLTEAIDMPNHDQAVEVAWGHAWALAFSTMAGIIFPFCTTTWQWMVVFVISCILFCSLYVRLYQRMMRFRRTPVGNSVDEQELHDRARLSFRLLQACSIMWTGIIVAFVACCVAGKFAPEGSWWANPALPLVVECAFEIGSKMWYLLLIADVHESIFDEGLRSIRRLKEMRDMMTCVWESSSDAIALCVRGKETINAVVSPTFLRLGTENVESDSMKLALLFEITLQPNSQTKPKHRIATMAMAKLGKSKKHSPSPPNLLSEFIHDDLDSSDQRNIASMAKLLAKSWHFNSRESLVMHDLYGETPTGELRTIRCEAKITKLANDAAVVVLRDISERFQRFETEKQLVIALTERKKDSEANRFARHEVKNSLMAALWMVNSIKDTMESPDGMETIRETMINVRRETDQSESQAQGSLTLGKADIPLNFPGYMRKLEEKLREVLDTLVTEAISREVVKEIYQPQSEATDIRSLLSKNNHMASSAVDDRFPIFESRSPFPKILIDPDLVCIFHCHAVSNAVKYGKQGGVVQTCLAYETKNKQLLISVTNQPGKNHAVLAEMNEDETAKIFSSGTRLNVNSRPVDKASDALFAISPAGGGAWIMQKCAATMGGQCTIKFEKDSTILSLSCPADVASDDLYTSGVLVRDSASHFEVPKNTWGIAVDDSGIQRKFLERFMSLSGIESSRQRILGGSDQEIFGFNEYLEKLIVENPDDKFMVIVDENLVVEEKKIQQTISGSKCIETLLHNLKPEDSLRLLALVRSEADSSIDIAMYKARTHGFISKSHIHKDMVLPIIECWWKLRFPTEAGVDLSRQKSLLQ